MSGYNIPWSALVIGAIVGLLIYLPIGCAREELRQRGAVEVLK